jgi:hypothetical protein
MIWYGMMYLVFGWKVEEEDRRVLSTYQKIKKDASGKT